VVVLQLGRVALRLLKYPSEAGARRDLHVALHLRLTRELGVERGRELRRLHAQRGEHARHDPVLLLQEREREVLDVDLAVAVVSCVLLRRDDGLLGLLGHLVRINHSASPRFRAQSLVSDQETAQGWWIRSSRVNRSSLTSRSGVSIYNRCLRGSSSRSPIFRMHS